MTAIIERIARTVEPEFLRDLAVYVATGLMPRRSRSWPEEREVGAQARSRGATGVLFSPRAADAALGRLERLGYDYAEIGPIRSHRDCPLAESAWQWKRRVEKRLRSLDARPRFGVRLQLPPVLDHHGFFADVVLAYRRVYPLAEWVVVDALDALVRPWAERPHRFVLEPLMATLQEWNRHYVRKRLFLRVPTPVGGHVRALVADLAERGLVDGIVLASGWRQSPAAAPVLEEGIAAVRRAAGRDLAVMVESTEEAVAAVLTAGLPDVTGLVDPLAGRDDFALRPEPAASSASRRNVPLPRSLRDA